MPCREEELLVSHLLAQIVLGLGVLDAVLVFFERLDAKVRPHVLDRLRVVVLGASVVTKLHHQAANVG